MPPGSGKQRFEHFGIRLVTSVVHSICTCKVTCNQSTTFLTRVNDECKKHKGLDTELLICCYNRITQ